MTVATLIWGAGDWLWPAAALAAAALALVAWGYRRASAAPATRAVAMALKTLGVVLLAACLVEPLLSGTRPRPGANLFAVIADNSQSLRIRDEGASVSRGDVLKELLARDANWQTRLSQDFEVRRYAFDERLQAVEDFTSLKFDGSATSLVASLENLAKRYRDRPLAGVLLASDGNATDWSDAAIDWTRLPPVFPIVIGADRPGRDVSVARVFVSQTSFEDAPVTLQAELAAVGCRGEKLVAQLIDEHGALLEEQTLAVGDEGQPLAARFQVKPERAGVAFYQVRVVPAAETAAFEKPERSREATLANNHRLATVDRGGGPYRVLYVAGRPNWEYKFLRRALEDDEQVQLVALLRIAKREPKFEFRGRAGESTNPLFRGFGNQADETAESYDKPVLVRLGTEDAAELRDGFPKSPEDLYRYHAIIVDDLEAAHFTPDQQVLVQKFVSQRGGGFLMLGGEESFAGGKYDRTPLGELLPVYLDRLSDAHPVETLRLNLQREGWLQPWVRLRTTETEERQRLQTMPSFQIVNRVRGTKPGATVLASVTDADGWEAPALVEQRFGRGRSLALLIGDLWRWQLKSADEEPHAKTNDQEKAWRQMVRWLVADVPQRIEVQPRHERDDPSRPVRIEVQARDARFEPLDNAAVTVRVASPDGERLELAAAASDQRAGMYVATYVARRPGVYRAEVEVAAPDGSEVGQRQTGWASDPAADEFRALRPDRDLLLRIARQTGGELVEAADLESFVARLPNLKAPITEPTITPLWHQPWVFLLAILCLCGEWGLRRWRGLP